MVVCVPKPVSINRMGMAAELQWLSMHDNNRCTNNNDNVRTNNNNNNR